MLEEGLPLHVAQRLLRGDLLYRNVVFFTGPLPFELLALLFRLFGESVAVARGAVVLLQGLATAAVFGIARRAGAGAFAHAAAAVHAAAPILLFPIVSIYFPSTLAMLLGTLAVYAAVRSPASVGWAVAAGVLAACVALCKQTVGVMLALPLLFGVVAYAPAGRRLRTGAAMGLGGLLVAIATVGLFAARGTAADLFDSLVTMPLSMSESFKTPLPAFWPPGDLGEDAWLNWPYYLPRLFVLIVGENPSKAAVQQAGLVTQLLYATPFVALAATAARAAFGRLPAAAALPAAALFAATAGMFPRSDWGHLSMALPSAWVQLVLVATAGRAGSVAAARARPWTAGLLVAGVGAASLAALLFYYALAAPQPWHARVPVRPVSEGYRTPAMTRVIDYLLARTRPGEAVFVARQEPLLYFVTGARNPTRYEGMMQGIRERQEAEILQALEGLRYVVMSEIDGPATGYYKRELPAVHAYLERHFRIPPDFPLDKDQWLVVYERGPDRGTASIDLVDAPNARFWAKGPEGRTEVPAAELPSGEVRHLRRPLAVPIGYDGGGVDFPLDVPAGARFEAGVGIFGIASSLGQTRRHWDATYSVSVVRDGVEQRLAEVSLPPDPIHGTWQTLEADLSAFAGQHVVLRLRVVARASRRGNRVGWWGSPRIVVPSAGPPS